MGQGYSQAGTFWGVLNLSRCVYGAQLESQLGFISQTKPCHRPGSGHHHVNSKQISSSHIIGHHRTSSHISHIILYHRTSSHIIAHYCTSSHMTSTDGKTFTHSCTLLQYRYLMSHFAYRFWVVRTGPVSSDGPALRDFPFSFSLFW